MYVFTWRRALVLGAVVLFTGCGVAIASSGGSVSAVRGAKMTKLQRRILSGFASFELRQTPGNEATTLQRPRRLSPVSNPVAADCPRRHGNNVKVNQNCLNITDRDLQGRAQAENETSMAVNPRTGQLIATYNDYRRGDGTCGPSYSTGVSGWRDSTLPNNFVRGTAFGGVEREIRVGLDPVRLQGVGLTALDVSRQLRGSNVDLAGGRSEIGDRDQAIRTLAGAKTLADLAATRIALPTGGEVRLDDLGLVALRVHARASRCDQCRQTADLVAIGMCDEDVFHIRRVSSERFELRENFWFAVRHTGVNHRYIFITNN